MTTVVSLLRGVNLAGHRKIRMDALRALYESLGLRNVQTYLQSGNVVFRSGRSDIVPVARRIEKGIEETFGFRADVIVRTSSELRDAVVANPFSARRDIHPGKLLVVFLAGDPSAESQDKLQAIKADPEELRIAGRELYIYFPNGMARPKLSWPLIEKTLQVSGTGRNWNTVRKLLEIAERLDASP